MSNAVVGHGAEVAIESNPVVAGTFTAVGELVGDLEFATSRAVGDRTPHSDNVSKKLVSPILNLESFTFEVNFIYNDSEHDESTGLQKHHHGNTRFGVQWRGPAGAADTDEIIMSGRVIGFRRIAGHGEGAYRAEVEFQPDGQFKVDGTTVTGA